MSIIEIFQILNGMGMFTAIGICCSYIFYILKRKHDYLNLTKEYYDSVYNLKRNLLSVICGVDSKLPSHLQDIEIIKQIYNKTLDADRKVRDFHLQFLAMFIYVNMAG